MASQSIFSWLTGARNKSRHAGNKRVPARRWRLGVESLEDRLALATVIIDATEPNPDDWTITVLNQVHDFVRQGIVEQDEADELLRLGNMVLHNMTTR